MVNDAINPKTLNKLKNNFNSDKAKKRNKKAKKKTAPAQKIKAVSNNAGLERQFRKELQDFSLKVNHSLAWWLKSKFNAPNADKNIVKELEKEFKHLSEYWIKKADELGKEILPKLFAKIGKSADMPFLKNVDFDPTRKSQELKNTIQASISENMALIKSIPQEAIQRHSAIMYQAVNDFDEQALMKELTTISNIGKRRAKMIAGDQVKKALNSYSRARAQSLGYQYYEWLSSKDERVSTGYGGHKQLNGRIYRLDKPTAIIDSYGHIGHVGQRVNCLAKGQGIDLNNFINRVFRASSFNKFARIIMCKGEVLEVSREHKVLTPRGWVMAKTLKKGDKIVKISDESVEHTKINFKHDKIILSQVVEFFTKFTTPGLRNRLAYFNTAIFGNFNADVRRDENVDIVDINSFLENGAETIFNESIKNLNLPLARVAIIRKLFFSSFLTGECSVNSFLDSAFGASDRFVCFFSDSFAVFEGTFLKSDEVSLRARSDFISEFFDNSIYCGTANAEVFTHLQNAIATDISLFNLVYIYAFLHGQKVFFMRNFNPVITQYTADSLCGAVESPSRAREIKATFVEVDDVQLIEKNSTHIYSLESYSGYYTINGLINKNCRCSSAVVYLMPNQELELIKDSYAGDYYKIKERDT